MGIPRGDIACPVMALEVWIEAAGISEGAVFRRVFNRRAQRVGDQRLGARDVASVVKAAAAKLGFDPATFGGHSLRSGPSHDGSKGWRHRDRLSDKMLADHQNRPANYGAVPALKSTWQASL